MEDDTLCRDKELMEQRVGATVAVIEAWSREKKAGRARGGDALAPIVAYPAPRRMLWELLLPVCHTAAIVACWHRISRGSRQARAWEAAAVG